MATGSSPTQASPEPSAGTGIWLVLGVAFLLRVVWWALVVRVIENEGTEYARLAENLFAGRGYVGMFGSFDPSFPPLYPILIGLMRIPIRDAEIAGRLVSLAAGLGLVWCCYWATREILGQRPALVAAWVAATHPVLVGLSVSVYSEMLASALIMAGLFGLVSAIKRGSWRGAVAAGAAFGLAALARPELIAYAAVGSAFVALSAWRQAHRSARAAALGLLPVGIAFLVSVPWALVLSSKAGHFVWEGKSVIIQILNTRMRAGMGQTEAAVGLPTGSWGNGPYLLPDQLETVRHPPPFVNRRLESTLRAAPRQGKKALHEMWEASFIGAPWLWLLALTGLTLPWWRLTALGGLLLLAMGGLQAGTLLLVEYPSDRFLLPLLPLAIPWAAAGMVQLGAGSHRLVRSGWPRAARHLSLGTATAAVLGLDAWALHEARWDYALRETRLASARLAGERLRDEGRRSGLGEGPIVMGQGAAIAYYARGTGRMLPYGDEGRVLQFVHNHPPAFLTMRNSDHWGLPYADAWFQRGIPDSCAIPLFTVDDATGASVRAWRWSCPRDAADSVKH